MVSNTLGIHGIGYFGFINEKGVDKEHFVHVTGLIDEIREGDQVEFDLEQGRKGLNAVNVTVI